MITLNEIAYNIKNLAYGGKSSLESDINIRQIKHWIHYHRAKLIADNIDKGITNNQALYQGMSLTLRDSTNSIAKNFYDAWDAYDINSSLTPPVVTGAFLSNSPKTAAGDRLDGTWLAQSSLTVDDDGDQQAWADQHTRSFYGDEIASSQVKGDFRNFGYHAFWTPRPLQLKNDQGVKHVVVDRTPYFPDDPVTTSENEQSGGYSKQKISLYHGKDDNFISYNKFTDYNNPYYLQSTSRFNDDHPYGNTLVLKNLQVSPNYHGGLNIPGNKKIFWKYRGHASMILENPTEIDMMSDWNFVSTSSSWDDSKTPYPIPMEYLSDLIQRVIQIEVQTELKTIPDVITDGQDDLTKLKMKGGTQVQR